MKTRKLLAAGLGAVGLVVYLWPALSAPVVLWSDSIQDLDWARRGVGIFAPLPAADLEERGAHPVKPGYLLFLRLGMLLAPIAGEIRGIVLLQSILLLAAIAAACLRLGQRRGFPAATVLCLLLILFLRLRDSASTVMSEAPAAGFLLLSLSFLLEPPRRSGAGIAIGFLWAALFWIRPNVGGVAALLGLAAWMLQKRYRLAALACVGLTLGIIPLWIATRPHAGEDPRRGLSATLLVASADYYWMPSVGAWPKGRTDKEKAEREERLARDNWRTLLAKRGPDARRQLLWRALHGLLGTDFYDSRWSPIYRRLDTASRLATPFLVLLAIAILLSFPFRGSDRNWNAVALLFLALLVAHNLVFGSLPRFLLPFLPGLFVLATLAVASAGFLRRRGPVALILAILLGFLAARTAYLLEWEWGRVEQSGVRIVQRIPKGALPATTPATLHVRVAPTVLPTNAGLRVEAGGYELYLSHRDAMRYRPDISVSLPGWLLEANMREPVEIALTSVGDYDRFHFLTLPRSASPVGSTGNSNRLERAFAVYGGRVGRPRLVGTPGRRCPARWPDA